MFEIHCSGQNKLNKFNLPSLLMQKVSIEMKKNRIENYPRFQRLLEKSSSFFLLDKVLLPLNVCLYVRNKSVQVANKDTLIHQKELFSKILLKHEFLWCLYPFQVP